MPTTTHTATTLIDRAVIRLSGEGVRDFLQGLVTNDVSGELPVWTGLLTPQGKALFDFITWADPANGTADVLIDCERDAAGDLARRLSIYRLRRPIVIAREEVLCVHWAPGGDRGVPDPRNPALGRRWLAPFDPVLPEASEAVLAHWRKHRLSLGIVEGLAEIGSDATLWLEANAREQNGVSFTKGCYVGQENTARMHHRSKVNRRLAVVAAEAEPKGARVWYPELCLAVVRERVG